MGEGEGGMGEEEKQTSESAAGRGGFPLPAWPRAAELSRSHKQFPQPSLSQCPLRATSWPERSKTHAPTGTTRGHEVLAVTMNCRLRALALFSGSPYTPRTFMEPNGGTKNNEITKDQVHSNIVMADKLTARIRFLT